MESIFEETFWLDFYQQFCNEINKIEFSYTIPKEEQLRSSLYAFIKDYYPVEVESNLIKDKGGDEFDLRVLLPNNQDLFIEIKRAWSIKDWSNKHSEFLSDWKDDIKKLSLNKASKKAFVLILFSDSGYSKFKINEISDFIQSSWDNTLFELPEKQLNKKINFKLLVWMEK